MISKNNKRILITLDKETILKLDYLRRIFLKTKSKTIKLLINLYYEKVK